MSNVWFECDIRVEYSGEVHVTVMNNHTIKLDFESYPYKYKTDITIWKHAQFLPLIELFLKYYQDENNCKKRFVNFERVRDLFGFMDSAGNTETTDNQEKNIIKKVVQDIFCFIRNVVEEYGRSTLSYAIQHLQFNFPFYQIQANQCSEYNDMIAHVACQIIQKVQLCDVTCWLNYKKVNL